MPYSPRATVEAARTRTATTTTNTGPDPDPGCILRRVSVPSSSCRGIQGQCDIQCWSPARPLAALRPPPAQRRSSDDGRGPPQQRHGELAADAGCTRCRWLQVRHGLPRQPTTLPHTTWPRVRDRHSQCACRGAAGTIACSQAGVKITSSLHRHEQEVARRSLTGDAASAPARRQHHARAFGCGTATVHTTALEYACSSSDR